MKTYEFTIKLVGKGEDEADAWEDAIECFQNGIGDPTEIILLEDDEEQG